jgi:type 2 lantibiotic biosynthesis protein LanM
LLEELCAQEAVGLLGAIEPLISQARDRFYKGAQGLIQGQADLPFDPGTVETLLLEKLPGSLLAMLSRTLVLELNVARLQGLLQGNTAEERFRSFIQRICKRETSLALLQEYPVLARQLVTRLDHWVNFSLEFLRHLCADWAAIRITFSPEDDPGVLVWVNGNMGDSHRDGRSVLIAGFSSGFRVVYKPRSMTLDLHFQELLTWLNDRGDHPSFRTLKILDRGYYGWIEFVVAQGCTSEEEIQRFYERQGAYLALLYALGATDFHYENLIAAGAHPVLLDLEALFHQRIRGADVKQADQLASNTLSDSVLGVGLLPQRIWANLESEGIDLSGLGGAAGQLTPNKVPTWEGAGTDEMRLVRKRLEMSGSQNRPTLNGIEVNVLDYAEQIVAGFTTLYQLLLKHRNELLVEDGPLARFSEDEVRVIVRPTQTYATLLDESYHPDVLRNALERDRLFDRLWDWGESLPYLARVIPAERRALWNCDIPIFTARPSSRDIWDSANERIHDFFEEPGLAFAQRRLQQLSDHGLRQQLWFIRASLATLSTDTDQARWPSYRLTEPQTTTDRERLLAAARAAGDRLAELALRGEDDVSWIGLTPTNENHWSLVPLGPDLYDGLPGNILFLAYLGAITLEERYTALAQAALTTMRGQVERSQEFITAIGGFNGWGGVIYALTHLAVLWDQPALLAEAEAVVEHLPAKIEQDKNFDIIGGGAGCIGSLLSLYRCASSQRTLAAAIQCGDRLIACAQPMEQGIGWIPPVGGTKPLAGFSHGAAGVAWALLELAELTGEERFRVAALSAIAYERSLFSPEAGNWPDIREQVTQTANEGQQVFLTGWCHGAPGVGLARLRTLGHLDDTAVRAEIQTALRTTLSRGFGLNHSLCHGDLGNLELLLQASWVLDDLQWPAQVSHLAAVILESIST